jgi:hypothetical protein
MITPETLEHFIEVSDTATVLSTLSALSEKERRGLSTKVLQLLPTMRHNLFFATRESISGPKEYSQRWLDNCRIVTLFCCEWKDIKRLGPDAIPDRPSAGLVLRRRNPKWLSKWCVLALADDPAYQLPLVCELEKEGLVTIEHGTNYYQALAIGLSALEDSSQFITNNPAIEKEILAMLRTPDAVKAIGAPEAFAREVMDKTFNRPGFNPVGMSSFQADRGDRWIETLTTLSERDSRLRSELIGISFEVLANVGEQQKKRGSSWIPVKDPSEFVCSLNEAICQDKVTYKGQYAALVGVTNTDVASFALNILLQMPLESFPLEDFLANISLVFHNPAKECAQLALSLLDRLAVANALRLDEIGLAIISAFNHKSKSVHKEALQILARHELLQYPAVAMKLKESVDLLEGTNRSQANSLIAAYRAPSLARETITRAEVSGQADFLDAVRELDPTLNELAGVSNLSHALIDKHNGRLISASHKPVDLYSFLSPRLDPANRLKPIENLDDLIFLMVKALSEKLSGEDYELILEAVARFCNAPPDDLIEKLHPLSTRLETITHAGGRGDSNGPGGSRAGALTIVARAWCRSTQPFVLIDPSSTFALRCSGLASRIRRGAVLPMLATPTHKGGWIDPLTLIKRITEYNAQLSCRSLDYDRLEFTQALLRLAPEGRDVALRQAQSVQGEFGTALRYALGGGTLSTIVSGEFRLAAFSARNPFPTDECLKQLVDAKLPDGLMPVKYEFDGAAIKEFREDRYKILLEHLPNFLPTGPVNAFPVAKRLRQQTMRSQLERQEVEAEINNYQLLPTILLHSNQISLYHNDEAPLLWPQNREAWLARLAKIMLQHVDSIGKYLEHELDRLFDPDLSLAENGRWFNSLGLSAKSDAHARLTLDILISAVAECRIDPITLGQAMATFLEYEVITVVRWTRNLRELSRVSALHALFCWVLISTIIRATDTKIPLAFLELMLELEEEHRFEVDEPTRNSLKSTIGSGKAAKIAKAITTSADVRDGNKTVLEAAHQSMEARISRIKRWQSWADLQGVLPS